VAMNISGVTCPFVALVALGCVKQNENCAEYDCPPEVNLVAECLQDGSCTINGEATMCAGVQCPLFVLPPDTVIGLPLDWSNASRSDVEFAVPGADVNSASVAFDGQPAVGCVGSVTDGTVTCSSVPMSVQTVTFSYSQGSATSLSITMLSVECEEAHPGTCQD
jgi:hypothetical protein